jgi:hypothetical protein
MLEDEWTSFLCNVEHDHGIYASSAIFPSKAYMLRILKN